MKKDNRDKQKQGLELPDGQISIELSEEVAGGDYSNLVVITHSSSEFIFDFVSVMPGVPKHKVKNRIIMTPEHAKRFLFALQDNVNKYQAQFGEVDLHNPPTGNRTFNIGGGGPAQA